MRAIRTLVRSALAVLLLASFFSASPAQAAARSPQVPVSGTALATFFAAHGQTIDVNTQQLDLQRTSMPLSTAFQVQAFVGISTTVGVYNAAAASPALYQVYPGAASGGWFSVGSFRAGPQRLVVSLFDASSALQGSSTYLSADNTDFGFYNTGAPGTFYSQDARNAGGSARILAFNGTGAFAGSTWLCTETGAGPGGDFADVITLVQFQFAPVGTEPSTWTRVKRLYR